MRLRIAGRNQAGDDRVDSHLRAPFHREPLREIEKSRFRSAVRGGTGRGARRGHARDVDDAAAFGLRLHPCIRCLRAIEGRGQVELDDLVEEPRAVGRCLGLR